MAQRVVVPRCSLPESAGADESDLFLCSSSFSWSSCLDPSLKFTVVTKENVAAHAIAEHLVALQLLQEVQMADRTIGWTL